MVIHGSIRIPIAQRVIHAPHDQADRDKLEPEWDGAASFQNSRGLISIDGRLIRCSARRRGRFGMDWTGIVHHGDLSALAVPSRTPLRVLYRLRPRLRQPADRTSSP